MSNVAVIGAQWGDEGKGKIVDWLSEKADVVVRFQGGHNAGHTLVINNKTYKLKLLPSGIVRKNKISIIGNGVVIDPWALLDEIEQIKNLGIKINDENLFIAENATLILPFHKELDVIREDSKDTDKIGTTRRGIGPAYEDKVGRRGIRVIDLANEKNLSKKIDTILFHHNSIRKGLGKKTVDKEAVMKELIKISPAILKFSIPVWKKIEELKIIFGVNEKTLKNSDQVISAASCTTNCLAPVAKVINDNFGIETGFMTTITSYTADQKLLDNSHKDLRRARSAPNSIIPTTTGATKSLGDVIPQLKGKVEGISIRVPTPYVSLVEFVFSSEKKLSVEKINNSLSKASKSELKNILDTSNEQLISADFNHNPHSAIVDLSLTKVIEAKMAKVSAWYDNEWGYACRMCDLANYLGKI